MEQNRKYERYYLSYYLKVIDRQTDLSIGHCADISHGGMKVISEEPIKTKNIFQLKMFLPVEIQGSRHVNFVAISKWCQNDENPDFYNCGFQWHNITPETTKIIKHLINNLCLDELPKKSTSYKSALDLNKKIDYEDSISKHHGYLKVIGSDGEEKKKIELSGNDYLIGRTPECNIQFQVDSVSRQHALITFRGNEYWLEDLDSKNGTYINGVKIAKCVLRNDDQIDIGGVKMYFNETRILKEK